MERLPSYCKGSGGTAHLLRPKRNNYTIDIFHRFLKEHKRGTSLTDQWFGASPSNAGGANSIPGWGAKITHASRPKNQKKKNKSNILTNSIKTLKKGPHQKKKKAQKGRQDLVSNLKRMKKYFASGAEEPKEKKRKPAKVARGQGFSISALWTLGAQRGSAVEAVLGTELHCVVDWPASLPSTYQKPVATTSSSKMWKSKVSPDIIQCPQEGRKWAQVENHNIR